MQTPRRLTAACTASLFALVAARSEAIETPKVGGKPIVIDVTNTSFVSYRFDNRDDSKLVVLTQANDDYGEWLDRLNIQATWWRFRVGVRVDSALFFLTPTRDDIVATVADQRPILEAEAKKTNQDARQLAITTNEYQNNFFRELHSRYRRAIYPSKLFVGYTQPGVDLTFGDFYAQLGRGLVFSVRKIDELAVDTTVRGGKVVADRRVGPLNLGATLLAGQMNPIRVDQNSGRRLNGSGSPFFFGFPTGGDLEVYSHDADGKPVAIIDPARPSYLEDSVFGGSVEVGTKWASVAGNAVALLRDTTPPDGFAVTGQSRLHDQIVNFGGSVNVPSILKHGDLYVEVAGQQMRKGVAPAKEDVSGYAVYVNASANAGPVAFSLEGKHYRRFFPLAAKIDTTSPGHGAPEYSLVNYSQPPTAEPIYTQIVGGSPGNCITGGRARVDFRFNRETSVYYWLGRYTSWSENPGRLNPECVISKEDQTNTWDTAVGVDIALEGGKTHAKAWVGARATDHELQEDVTQAGPTKVFYHEGYVRYDLVKHLAGRFSLQFQGFHRRRFEPIAFAKPWNEGENYTALQWSPHISAIFGYEYLARDDCQPERPATLSRELRPAKNLCHYVSGGLQWRAGTEGTGAKKALQQVFNSVSVFVGQQRAALRCVSGVCRQFPPFEGARLEITSRF